MTKVKVIRNFKDVETKEQRKVGDEFEVSEARLKALTGDNKNNQVYVEVLKENFTMEDEEEIINETLKEKFMETNGDNLKIEDVSLKADEIPNAINRIEKKVNKKSSKKK